MLHVGHGESTLICSLIEYVGLAIYENNVKL